ncbi:MAG: methyltransferase, TIGR04325 family [Candidatus Margulisiibacteriota bacterium]
MKELLPPVLLNAYRYMRRSGITFSGPYRSWHEAKVNSVGYDSEMILEKVKNAMMKVKSGEAAYERDGVVFEKAEYSFPVLVGFLRAALANGGRLSVLDFGGSLGTCYYQNRKLLTELKEMRWSIVEQSSFVRCGRDLFADGIPKFYDSLGECLQFERPNAVLLSAVLQYVEQPYALLETIAQTGIKYVILDRTPLGKGENDVICVQHISKEIYEGSYPCWIFSSEKLKAFVNQKYTEVFDVDSLNFDALRRFNAKYRCVLFELAGARC